MSYPRPHYPTLSTAEVLPYLSELDGSDEPEGNAVIYAHPDLLSDTSAVRLVNACSFSGTAKSPNFYAS